MEFSCSRSFNEISWLKQYSVSEFYLQQFCFIFSKSLKGRATLKAGNLTISSLILSDEGTYRCSVIALGNPPPPIKLVVTGNLGLLATRQEAWQKGFQPIFFMY